MSAILDKLLKGQKVEFKQLWEVTVWDKRFNAVENHKQPKVDKYYYFLASDLKSLAVEKGEIKLLTTNISDLWTTEELVGDKVKEGEIIAIPWGGNPVVQYYKGKFVTADNRIATSNNTKYLDNKYLYYFLLNKIDLISSFYRGSGIKHPSMADVLNLEIPIPPLDVQAEIVRILDAFTAVTAELTAELNMREKQYQYYRDKLLTFSDNEIIWKSLGDLVLPTQNIKWKETLSSYRYIDLSSVDKVNNNIGETLEISSKNAPSRAQKIVKEADIIFATTRPTQMRVAIIPKQFNEQIASTGYCILRANQEEVIPKWIYYNLSLARFKAYLEENQSGVAYPAISDGLVKEFMIPVPSLKEQKRIVEILDKFETLTHSITQGLPKEIALRQRQYEYYREQLLDFPKN